MPALVFSAATRKSRKRVASSHLSALSELSSLTPKALEAGGGCNKADALAVARLKASLYCFLRVKWSANLSHSFESTRNQSRATSGGNASNFDGFVGAQTDLLVRQVGQKNALES